jgi:hypothetical protein
VSVAANSEAEATTLWVAKKGTHHIRISVDAGNRINEVVETNNDAELTVTASSAAVATSVPLDWLLLILGTFLLVLVAGVLAWQYFRPARAPAGKPEPAGMRVFRASGKTSLVCGKCQKPILEGEQYYKCGCDTRYHMACAPDGKCQKCALPEEEE